MDTLTCELKFALANRLAEWFLASYLVQALVCHVVFGLFNTCMIWWHVLAYMYSLLINVSVSIQVSQPHSNIEMYAALNKRILLSLTIGDLNIDLSLANAARASRILTLTARSVDQT